MGKLCCVPHIQREMHVTGTLVALFLLLRMASMSKLVSHPGVLAVLLRIIPGSILVSLLSSSGSTKSVQKQNGVPGDSQTIIHFDYYCKLQITHYLFLLN